MRITSEKFTLFQLIFEVPLDRKIETNIKYALYDNSAFFMAFVIIFQIIDISSSEMQSQLTTHTLPVFLPTHAVFNTFNITRPATLQNIKITYLDILSPFFM